LTDAFIAGENMPGVDQPDSEALAAFGASRLVLHDPTFDPRALQHTADSIFATRVMGYAFTNTGMSFNLVINDHQQHQLALYFADYENHRRSEVVTISDPTTGQVLAKQRVAKFAHGQYLLYQVRGSVVISINNEGFPNAVLSGIFLT
jgi:hypothetical protein